MTVIEEIQLSEERKRSMRQCQLRRRHNFDWIPPSFDPKSPVWHYKRHGRCLDCGTELLQALDVYGYSVYSRYIHPDGYKDLLEGLPTPAELRIANARKYGECRYSSTKQRKIEADIEERAERVLALVG